jgi:2-methylcitrate dehydratase PrpD
MGFCERAAEWASGLRASDVPSRVAARARLQSVSILAAGDAGRSAARPFEAHAPDGPLGQVFAGAAASIAHDWDDYLFMGHTGHSSVWTARAFAPDDAERAFVAQVAGNEVAGRLGAALFLGPHNGQFWSSIHCASAAIAAGVALRLGERQLAHALAIALYQPPYGLWPGFMGPDTKLLTAAQPAVDGARAALLAAEGVTGPLGVVEDPRGLLAHLSFAPRPRMLGELGRVWLTDTLAFKRYPGCAYLQAAVAATLSSGVAGAEIERVDVDAGYLTVGMEKLGAQAGLTPVGVTFSAARSVAVAALEGRLTHEELEPERLASRAREIEGLAARVHVRHDWELTVDGLRGVVDAGASVGDVPARAWPRVLRRVRELGMDEAGLPPSELRALVRNRSVRRELLAALRSGHSEGIARLDTGKLRMRFPCRLHIRLRSGQTLDVDGDEAGASARPLEDQRAVVAEKCAAVGLSADLVGDDALRHEIAVRAGHLGVDEAEAPAALDDAGAHAQVGAVGGAEELHRQADGGGRGRD